MFRACVLPYPGWTSFRPVVEWPEQRWVGSPCPSQSEALEEAEAFAAWLKAAGPQEIHAAAMRECDMRLAYAAGDDRRVRHARNFTALLSLTDVKAAVSNVIQFPPKRKETAA